MPSWKVPPIIIACANSCKMLPSVIGPTGGTCPRITDNAQCPTANHLENFFPAPNPLPSVAMGLDYTNGCVNFRDVGGCVNLITDRQVLPEGRILRGGTLNFVEEASQIGNPGTIVNLRKGADPAGKRFGADYWHFPISSNHEKYDTTNSFVRRWLNRIISCLGQNVSRLPVFLHCTSGKDRTGVAIAALLTALGVDREAIVLEYLWSEGEIQRAWIEQALDGIGDPVRYFALLDLAELRDKFLHDSSPQSVP